MQTTDVQVKNAPKPGASRRVMEMDELSAHLAAIARPRVQAALEAEALDAGSEAWRHEAEQALGTLLRDEQLLRSADAAGAQVLQALRQGIENPAPPDEEEVREHATEVGRVMASAWLQFLLLALEGKDDLLLGESLLPPRADVREELWEALRSPLNPLPIGADEAPGIMKAFAEQFVASAAEVELPLGLSLDVQRGQRTSYVVRRR